MAQWSRILPVLAVFSLLLSEAFGAPVKPSSDRPDFVNASLLIVDPGGELYSCAGHAVLRMECPEHKLDYVFSYESEPVKERILTFLAGRLNMGMMAVPTAEYLETYRGSGRGIRQYRLNLPIAMKCRLWKLLDDKLAEGVSLPYDYLKRGCAQSVLKQLMESAPPNNFSITRWPAGMNRTCREIFCDNLNEFPWNRFFAQCIGGIEVERRESFYQKLVIPRDLLEVLKATTVDGQIVIASYDKGTILVPSGEPPKASWFSPLVAAALFGIIMLIAVMFKVQLLLRSFAVLYGIFGILYTYLVFFSPLPGVGWHWLVIPFNVLPVLLWQWRNKWAKWFSIILTVWVAVMTFWPHLLVDPAHLILVAAYAVFFTRPCRNC